VFQTVYWHRELPPLDATALGEHTVEATSHRVPDTITHRDDLWDRAKDDLTAQTRDRLAEETARLGVATRMCWVNRSICVMTQPPAKRGSMAASPTCCIADQPVGRGPHGRGGQAVRVLRRTA
jgi:hypothetical protein